MIATRTTKTVNDLETGSTEQTFQNDIVVLKDVEQFSQT